MIYNNENVLHTAKQGKTNQLLNSKLDLTSDTDSDTPPDIWFNLKDVLKSDRKPQRELITHLWGEDVVGHIHHTVVMVTKAFHFGHHSGLNASIGHLISFLVDKDPAAGQKKKQHNAFNSRSRVCLKKLRL